MPFKLSENLKEQDLIENDWQSWIHDWIMEVEQ